MEQKLSALDLFSGIGGLSLAVDHVAATRAYVEINFYSQQVLKARMADCCLHKAPIYEDVCKLEHPGQGVEMMCGGFPCQDISTIGLGAGIVDGKRSGLFYEIMRLCDASDEVKVLFLENVANIRNAGGAIVVEELRARGFNCRWLVHSASELGAPHVRKRWFCLAVRGDFSIKRLMPKKSNRSTIPPIDAWRREPCMRAVHKSAVDSAWPARLATLGNSVVPAVARAAFDALVSGFANVSARDAKVPFRRAPLNPLPISGMVLNGFFYPASAVERAKAAASGTEGSCSGSGSTTLVIDGKERVMRHLPTPRHGNVRASKTVNARSTSDLGTVLVQCEETKRRVGIRDSTTVCDTCAPNPLFVEWMMGYPPDWTRVVAVQI